MTHNSPYIMLLFYKKIFSLGITLKSTAKTYPGKQENFNASVDLQSLTRNPSKSGQTGLCQLFHPDEPALLCNDHPDAAESGDSPWYVLLENRAFGEI